MENTNSSYMLDRPIKKATYQVAFLVVNKQKIISIKALGDTWLTFFQVFLFVVKGHTCIFVRTNFLTVPHSGILFFHKHLFHISLVFVELHGVGDGDGNSKFLHVVVGTDVSKSPVFQ